MGTNWPDGALDHHLHTQERKQLDTGQTNLLFSKVSYYSADRMTLFQICLGSLSRTNLRPCLQVPCKKDKEMHPPPPGISFPPTSGHIPSLLRTPLGRGAPALAASSHPACLQRRVSDCEAPVRLQVKSVLSWWAAPLTLLSPEQEWRAAAAPAEESAREKL